MSIFIKSSPCASPCPCSNDPCNQTIPAPSATLKCDSISASKSKCGFQEYVPSTPVKVYLQRDLSGTLCCESRDLSDCSDGCQTAICYTYSGTNQYSRPNCSHSNTEQVVQQDFDDPNCTPGTVFPPSTPPAVECNCTISSLCTESLTATTRALTGSGVCYHTGAFHPYQTITGSASETLSNEYTLLQLYADCGAALPPYPGTYVGTCSANAVVPSDQTSITLTNFKYKFQLPNLTGFLCYKLTWLEAGTPMSYLWNGTDTETPVYGPVVEGAPNTPRTITNIVASCACA